MKSPRHIRMFAIFLMAAGISGCFDADQSDRLFDYTPPSKEQTYALRVVSYGTSPENRKNRYISGLSSRIRIRVKWMFWYLEGSGRKIVIDPGFKDEEKREYFQISDYETPDKALAKIGISAADITDVLLTHHLWHRTDYVSAFPNATFYIPTDSYAYAERRAREGRAQKTGISAASIEFLRQMESQGRLVRIHGGTDIFPGVRSYDTHLLSPSSVYYAVNTADGVFVIAPDIAPLYENIIQKKPIPKERSEDVLLYYEHMLDLTDSPYKILPGFDQLVFEHFKTDVPGILKVSGELKKKIKNNQKSTQINQSIKQNSELRKASGIYNMHEHIGSLKDAEKYLEYARSFGIEKTLLLGSYNSIINRNRNVRYTESGNTNNAVIEIFRNHPESFIPFYLIDYKDQNKLDSLKKALSEGFKGAHIRAGTGSHFLDLDSDELWEIYEFCEKNSIPVVIHYQKTGIQDIENILSNFPELKINVSHLVYSIDNLDYLDYLLSKYPNLYTDLSYGYLNWMIQNFTKMTELHEDLKQLILKHRDNILWGTDHVFTSAVWGKGDEYCQAVFQHYRRLIEDTEFHSEIDGHHRIFKGFNLSRPVQKMIYENNASNFLNGNSFKTAPELPQTDQKLSLFLTGSSLPGEGMNRSDNRSKNQLIIGSRLKSLMQNADISHVSIETPLAENIRPERMKFYSEQSDIEFIKETGIDVVELTGNHLQDYGNDNAGRMINKIRASGARIFGGGRNAAEAVHPLLIRRNGQKITFLGYNDVSGKATRNEAGANPLDIKRLENDIRTAEQNGDFTIVSFQWGDEFDPQLDHWQRRLTYSAVDWGADLIIGTHAHAYLSMETYKNVPIYHGLGNFLFADNSSELTRLSAGLELNIYKGKIENIIVHPILQNENSIELAENPETYLNFFKERDAALSSPERTLLDAGNFLYKDSAFAERKNLDYLSRIAGLNSLKSLENFKSENSNKIINPLDYNFNNINNDNYPDAYLIDLSSDLKIRSFASAVSDYPEQLRDFLTTKAGSVYFIFSMYDDVDTSSRWKRYRFLKRRFFFIRNLLEHTRSAFPDPDDAGNEWGYDYSKEIVYKGLNLDTPVLKKLYMDLK